MAPVPKRHHFVPTFLIRNFAGTDGLVWFMDKESGQTLPEPRNPNKVLFRSHLYTAVDVAGSKDVSQEIAFGLLENAAAPVVKRIVKAARVGRVPGLTAQEKETWDSFLYEQWRRVPDLRKSLFTPEFLQSIIDESVSDYRNHYGPLGERDHAFLNDDIAISRMKENALVAALGRRSHSVLQVLAKRSLAVLVIQRTRKSFILGSRPVIKLTPDPETNLEHPSVEMWLPVAPDVAVGIGQPGQKELLIHAPDDWVRRLNLAILAQSTQAVSQSFALISSLVRPR